MNCRMKMMFSILLLSMCPTWSFAQTTGSIGASGGPPDGGSSIGGPPPGGKMGSGDMGSRTGMAGPGGMRGGGGMPGGMPGGRSGSGSVPGRIKLTFPGGDSSSGGEGGGGFGAFGGGEGGMEQPLGFELNGISYPVSRTYSFRYVPHSFRPTKQNFGQVNAGAGFGGGPPGMMGEGSGAPGGYGGGGMGMATGGMGGSTMGGGFGFPGAAPPDAGGGFGNQESEPAIDILAFVIVGETVNDRPRIELAVRVMNGMGMEDNYEPFQSTSKGDGKFTSSNKLSESEIKLVSDIIRQTIWMEDALKLIRQSKGQGDVAESNEKLLKQLLAEQYDTQITRRELEAESIKNRLDALQEELKRRKLAKDRVVEVQWGRLILDAQGLLNKE